MIDNAALSEILTTAVDLSVVAEFYSADAVPTADGFDPIDAVDCFAAIDGISFRGVDYKRYVKSFGTIKRTITKEINSASVTFSNLDTYISQFEFSPNRGFEGLIMVIRLLSRNLSQALTDTQVLFTGRCEQPLSGKKDALSVTAKFILDSTDVKIPRRTYGPEDALGRVETDPEFEGFIFHPQTGTATYSTREKRGGVLGWFGFKKTVRHTLNYSSYSDIDVSKPVPEVFGYSQLLGTHLGYDDVGLFLRLRTAWCEGEIEDFLNVRSLDTAHPLDASRTKYYGKTGIANGNAPGWVADGYYSRTANMTLKVDNSTMDEVDAAPEVAAVIQGRLLKTPDGSGDWDANPIAWTDNAAAVTRYLLTEDYYELDPAWIDDDTFNEAYNYNAESIFDRANSDFYFLTTA